MAELGSMPQALPLHTPMLCSRFLCRPKNCKDSLSIALRAAQSRRRVDRPSFVLFTEVSLHLAQGPAHSRHSTNGPQMAAWAAGR